MTARLELPPAGTLRPNGPDDPLRYYYHPWLGWIFRHRLQMGLDLLPEGGTRVLEVGVGSGILVPTLTRRYPEYLGADLALAPDLPRIVTPGCRAEFQRADLLEADAFPAAAFDAIVCFSVLEHVADSGAAAAALARALRPGGTLIAGYPMVSAFMSRAFAVIGHPAIDRTHVSAPVKIAAALHHVLRFTGRRAFPPRAPLPLALYQCTRWLKPAS